MFTWYTGKGSCGYLWLRSGMGAVAIKALGLLGTDGLGFGLGLLGTDGQMGEIGYQICLFEVRIRVLVS